MCSCRGIGYRQRHTWHKSLKLDRKTQHGLSDLIGSVCYVVYCLMFVYFVVIIEESRDKAKCRVSTFGSVFYW